MFYPGLYSAAALHSRNEGSAFSAPTQGQGSELPAHAAVGVASTSAQDPVTRHGAVGRTLTQQDTKGRKNITLMRELPHTKCFHQSLAREQHVLDRNRGQIWWKTPGPEFQAKRPPFYVVILFQKRKTRWGTRGLRPPVLASHQSWKCSIREEFVLHKSCVCLVFSVQTKQTENWLWRQKCPDTHLSIWHTVEEKLVYS